MRFKLYGSIILLLTLLVSFGGFAVWQGKLQQGSIQSLYNQTTSADWLRQAVGFRADILQYLWTTAATYEKKNPESISSSLKDLNVSIANFTNALERYEDELNRAKKEGQERAEERKAYEEWKTAWQPIKTSLTRTASSMGNAEMEHSAVIELATKLSDDLLIINDCFTAVSESLRNSGMRQNLDSKKRAYQFRILTASMAAIGLLIVLIVLWIVKRTIRNLQSLIEVAKALSAGNVEDAERILK